MADYGGLTRNSYLVVQAEKRLRAGKGGQKSLNRVQAPKGQTVGQAQQYYQQHGVGPGIKEPKSTYAHLPTPTPDPAPPNAPSSLPQSAVDKADLKATRGALTYRALKRKAQQKGGAQTNRRIASSGLRGSQVESYLRSLK